MVLGLGPAQKLNPGQQQNLGKTHRSAASCIDSTSFAISAIYLRAQGCVFNFLSFSKKSPRNRAAQATKSSLGMLDTVYRRPLALAGLLCTVQL